MKLFSRNRPYTGPVVFMDGWHWSVKNNRPHRRVVLEDDGTMRFARKGDASWQARAHSEYVDLLRKEA